MYLLTLIAPDEDLNHVSRIEGNLVHYAVTCRHLPFVEALVQRGVSIDVRNIAGLTPLDNAIRLCHLPIVRFLLERVPSTGTGAAGRAA